MAVFESFDGLKLHYDLEGAGPPVVLLHGFGADTQQNWRSPGVITALAGAGRQVVGLDARGHGLSEKPHEPAGYETGAMVKDVAALFDGLCTKVMLLAQGEGPSQPEGCCGRR